MKKSLLIAVIIAVVAVIWILSGVLGGNGSQNTSEAPSEQTAAEENEIPEVRVQNLTAQPMNDQIEVTGRTRSSRTVNVSAETDGQVASIRVDKGEVVKRGQILARLGIRDREARVLEAKQLVNQRNIQYNASKELTEKGFNSRVRLAEALAQLESAKAQLKQTRVELSNINITAPFDGVVNEQMVEIGDYVSKGDEMFNIVDLDPIEIVGFLTEKQVEYVEEGSKAKAVLLRGQEVDGDVTFIAAAANAQTRTFEMEMTLANPDHQIKEGLTAKIKIPIQEASAYKVSSSILTLSDEGAVGVKIVNMNNEVEFQPIRLLKDTPEYLWIGGLPEKIQIITVGQEFVISGQKVTPVISNQESLL